MSVYPCNTATDARRAVNSFLFGAMRRCFWYEIAAALRYVEISREEIDAALYALLAEGRIERTIASDGRYLYRTVFR